MRIDILSRLAKNKNAFTFEDAYKILGINRNAARALLSRLEKGGAIERVEKGKYIIIPLGAEKGKYTLHEFVIGAMLVNPYSIAYRSALNFYGLTEQIPTTVFIQTTTQEKWQEKEIFGVRYKIVKIKKEKFFGIKKKWIEETEVNIIDKEKNCCRLFG